METGVVDRRSAQERMLSVQLDVVKAHNDRLSEENALLRHKLNRLTTQQSSSAALSVQAKLKVLQLQDEYDLNLENLERLKKKYNKLHAAYLDKVKRCKALEDMFQRQKTLTGLVMKSSLEQQQKEDKLKWQQQQHQQQQQLQSNDKIYVSQNEIMEAKINKLQAALDEAYDIIDELEFDLESIDYLELENQRLNNELSSLKRQQTEQAAVSSRAMRPSIGDERNDSEAPPTYEESAGDGSAAMPVIGAAGAGAGAVDGGDTDAVDHTTRIMRSQRHLVTSSICESCCHDDDADIATMERAALTNSLLQTVETESKRMRRELLRHRLQNALRPKINEPTANESDI